MVGIKSSTNTFSVARLIRLVLPTPLFPRTMTGNRVGSGWHVLLSVIVLFKIGGSKKCHKKRKETIFRFLLWWNDKKKSRELQIWWKFERVKTKHIRISKRKNHKSSHKNNNKMSAENCFIVYGRIFKPADTNKENESSETNRNKHTKHVTLAIVSNDLFHTQREKHHAVYFRTIATSPSFSC